MLMIAHVRGVAAGDGEVVGVGWVAKRDLDNPRADAFYAGDGARYLIFDQEANSSYICSFAVFAFRGDVSVSINNMVNITWLMCFLDTCYRYLVDFELTGKIFNPTGSSAGVRIDGSKA